MTNTGGNDNTPTTRIINGEVRNVCKKCRKNITRKGNVFCWMCH